MESEVSSKSWRKGLAALLMLSSAVAAIWPGQSWWALIEQHQFRIIVCATFAIVGFFYLMLTDRWHTVDERKRHADEKTAISAKAVELENKTTLLQERVNGGEYEYSRRIVRVHREWLKTRDKLVDDLVKAATNIGSNMGRPEFSRHMNNIIQQNKDVRPELTEVTQALAVTKETL